MQLIQGFVGYCIFVFYWDYSLDEFEVLLVFDILSSNTWLSFSHLGEGKTTMYFSILGSPWQIWCHHELQRWHFWKPLHIFSFLNAWELTSNLQMLNKAFVVFEFQLPLSHFVPSKKTFLIIWYIETIRHLSKQYCAIFYRIKHQISSLGDYMIYINNHYNECSYFDSISKY